MSGIAASEEGSANYTIPMVHFPDGNYLMDSRPIADKLEELKPQPSLHLDYDKLELVTRYCSALANTTRPCWAPLVARNLLLPRSREYFERTRKERFGMSLEQLEKEQGTDERWVEAQPTARALGDTLRQSGGPFFMGQSGKSYEKCALHARETLS